jgi:hypothetical protein
MRQSQAGARLGGFRRSHVFWSARPPPLMLPIGTKYLHADATHAWMGPKPQLFGAYGGSGFGYGRYFLRAGKATNAPLASHVGLTARWRKLVTAWADPQSPSRGTRSTPPRCGRWHHVRKAQLITSTAEPASPTRGAGSAMPAPGPDHPPHRVAVGQPLGLALDQERFPQLVLDAARPCYSLCYLTGRNRTGNGRIPSLAQAAVWPGQRLSDGYRTEPDGTRKMEVQVPPRTQLIMV